MAHLQSPFASSSSRKLSGKRKFLCLSGLKEGIFLIDVDERVFHSTYRATHYLIASISRVSHLDDQPSQAHSPPTVEKPIHCENSIDKPVWIPDRAQHVSLRRGDNNSQTSICYIDTQKEERTSDGFAGIKILRSHPGPCSLFSREPLPNGHADAQSDYPSSQGVDNPTSPGMHISHVEIQGPCGASEFFTEHPEAPSTPDLQPEVKSWDFEGLCNGDVKDSYCTIENVCNNDDDRYSVVLEENDFMSACIEVCTTKIFDVKDSFCLIEIFCNEDDNDWDNLVSEGNDIMSVCIGSLSTRIFDAKDISCTIENVCNTSGNGRDSPVLEENDCISACTCNCLTENFNALMQQIEVLYTGDNCLFDPSNASVDCWRGANTNDSLQNSKLNAQRWCRIWKVFNILVISSLNICDTPSRKKLFFQSFMTAEFRLTLQELFRLLKRRNLDWEVDGFEQLIVYTKIYLRVCKSRYLPAQERRAVAASCFVQDNLKCHWRGIRIHVSLTCFSLEHNSSGIEQAGHYASISSSKVGDGSASRFSHPPEARDEKCPRSTQSSSDDFVGLSRILRGYAEHEERRTFESDQSSHKIFSEMSGGRASKLPIFLEVRDGGMTSSTESPCKEMDEFEEYSKNSSGFPSCSSTNKVDDWTSVSADQVDECLDTCLYNLQDHPPFFLHDFTPELKLLDPMVMGTSSKSANNSSIDDGSQIFDVHANGNEDNVSCLPFAEPRSHTPSLCPASLSFDAEERQSSLPYEGVHERQSREKLKHFAEGFLLRCHIRRQQRRAQQAPPYPTRDLAGPVYKYQGASDRDLRTNPHTICSIKASRENNNEPAMIVTSSTTDLDCFVGADVVIDIVGLVKYVESQCSQAKTSRDPAANLINYADKPLIAGQVLISNFSAVIVTIIAIVVYTKTLLEGGLAWVGARAQKEEDN